MLQLSDFYAPLNTVNVVDKEINNNTMKWYMYLGLMIASSLFLGLTSVAIFQSHFFTKLHPTINVKLYLVILTIMIIVDLVAVYFEMRNLVKEKPKVRQAPSKYISVFISLLVGSITFYIFYFHLKSYVKYNVRETKLDGAILTFLKMLVALAVFFRAYDKIKNI